MIMLVQLVFSLRTPHLEQLNSDDSEEELEEESHHDNVADSFDGDNQTLDDLL